MKIVINNCYGGFGLSNECLEYVGNMQCKNYRTNAKLIDYIEKYGSKKASNQLSELIVAEIPSGTYYRITDYDGAEGIEYRDNIDWEVAT